MPSKLTQSLSARKNARKTKQKEKRIAEGFTLADRYRLVSSHPLEELQTKFINHHRLQVFAHKGLACVSCGVEGTQLLLGESTIGTLHYDVYTADNVLMTVDHIIPRVEGGGDELENLQPMCAPCNSKKGRVVDPEALKLYLEAKAVTKLTSGAYLSKETE